MNTMHRIHGADRIQKMRETGRGDTIMRTATSANRRATICRVLIFSLFLGMFITQGWYDPKPAQAAAVWQATGTVATAAGAVAWPAHAVNDVALLFVSTANEPVTLSTPAGFVEIANSPQSTGTAGGAGGTRLTVYWARATGAAMTSPVIGGTYNYVAAVIVTFRGVSPKSDPWEATAGGITDPASTTTTFPAVTTTIPGSLIVLAAAVDLDLANSAVWSAFANANLTSPTERVDQTIATGRGGGLGIATAGYTGPGNTGTSTGTHTSSITTQLTIALRPSENLTRTGGASAAAAGANSILVTMPYTADDNNNNTYSVAYKLSISSTWTNWTTNAAHVASPYTTTITGLTAGEIYDVRATYNDADTVSGANPQIIEAIATGPTNVTTAGYVTIKAAKNSIQVRMPFFNDGNNNKTFKVDYRLSTAAPWTNWVTGATATYSPYTTTITSLQTGTKYDIQATYTDADGTAGFGTGNPRVQTVTKIVTNALLHNSNTTLSSKWTGSRGWGYEGSKYGEIVCDTCHAKNTTNIKRIKSTVTASVQSFPGSAVSFRSTTTPSGFGDDTAAHATSQKICEVCHSVNSFHNYNQATAQTHQNNVDCMSACHSHNAGFSGDGPCKSCHNAAINEAYNTRQVTGAGGDFVRASKHVSDGTTAEIVTDYDCIVCHAEGDAIAAAAGTGYVDGSKHRNGASASTRMVKLRNVDNISQTYDWNKNARTTAMRDNMDTFCMNCHDANGASQINVNGTNNGLNLNNTRALTPFNTNDTLRGNTTDVATLGTFRSTTYGRVLNVKDQFNSGNAAGRNWASHHNLNQFTKRYITKNTTNWPTARLTAYVTREGKSMNGTANGDGETAGLHCSDCHLNETNAHGAVNSRYMLDNGAVDQTDTDVAWTGGDGGTHVCYKCHDITTYGAGGSGTAQTFNHSDDAGNTFGQIGSPMGIVCFNCHGGYSSGLQGGLGAIHGTNESYTPGGSGTTSKRYRFMSGSIMRFYRPDAVGTTNISDANWEDATGGGCYTAGVAGDTWKVTACDQHAGGRDTGATTGNRPLEQP